jgi:flagellar motor switch protein FliM
LRIEKLIYAANESLRGHESLRKLRESVPQETKSQETESPQGDTNGE